MKTKVVKLPAGVGKTSLAAKQVANGVGIYPVEIYAPTLDMAYHWYQLIQESNPKRSVKMIIGRNRPFDDGSTLCARGGEAAKLSEVGLPVYSRLCKTSDGAFECPYYRKCAYIDQFDSRIDIFIYTHAHLFLDRGRLEQRQPQLVIIDESFIAQGVEEVTVDTGVVGNAPWLPEGVRSFVRDLKTAMEQDKPLSGICREYRRNTGGITGLIESLDGLVPVITPTVDVAAILKQVDARLIAKLKKLLRHVLVACRYQEVPQSITLRHETSEIMCQVLKPITRFKVWGHHIPPTIMVLDASASRSLIERFLPVDEFVQRSVKRNAYVVQCSSTVSSTSSLIKVDKDGTDMQVVPERLQDLHKLINRVSSDGKKLLVVGPAAVVGNTNKGKTGLLTVPQHCDMVHFNALRGEDKWKDFDAVLVIGRNEPPVEVMEKMATALYTTDPRPLQLLNGEYLPSAPRGYRMKDESLAGVDAAVHPDSRVQEVIELHRECETLQAIDRLRLVHSLKTKLVLLTSNLPLDIDVDEHRSWQDFIHGTRLEQAYAQSDGTLPLAPGWLAQTFPSLWSTEAAAKKDMQRAVQKGHISLIDSYRKLSPLQYQYRPPGQKLWSRCVSRQSSLDKVKKALKKLLGVAVEVRLQG